jgi:ABC-type glycerol-3-phosphate transport system substrate-binding protein
VLGGGYIAVPKNAPHRPQALALARHLLGKETQETFARRLGWFAVRRDVVVGETAPALAGFAAMRAHVRPRPERADYPRLSRLWQQAFRAVVFESADAGATLEEAARTLQ